MITMPSEQGYPHGEALKPGHVTTIERGFYKEGEFGIRIELVQEGRGEFGFLI